MKLFSKISQQDLDNIKQAIADAEQDTSGEIRVHLEDYCKSDVMGRAMFLFRKLKINRTQLHNGVLFYLATESRQFAVIGDSGINKAINDDFWEKLKSEAFDYFRKDKYGEGLVHVIHETGQELKKNFPYQKDDINELPNDISFGEDTK